MENIVIIGGGPAGLSAGLYLARAGLKPLIFAGSPPGGQLTLTSEIENFPGQKSILGMELIETMRQQVKNFGGRIIDENVSNIQCSIFNLKSNINDSVLKQLNIDTSVKTENFKSEIKEAVKKGLNLHVVDAGKKSILTSTILIATGAKAIWLGLESETRLRGKGVSACATCDGFFFRNKVVAVVGGGDTALEDALTLTKFASKVYIIHRRNDFRASKIMSERVKTNPKIEILWNTVVEEVLGEHKVEGVRINKSEIRNPKSDKLAIDGLFVAIGHKPDTELVKGKVELDEKGYIITGQQLAVQIIEEFKKDSIVNSSSTSSDSNIHSRIFSNSSLSSIYQQWKMDIKQFPSSTSIQGVFAAGDCVDHLYRQASTSSGMGVAAALDIQRYLEEK